MSHNKIKVGGQDQNASGEIDLNLENLSDVNVSTITDNHALTYDAASSEWKNEALPFIARKTLGYGYYTKAITFNTGSTQYDPAGTFFRFLWRVSGANGIYETSLITMRMLGSSTTAWRDTFEFEETGKFLVIISLHKDGGTGTGVFRFYDETNSVEVGPKFYISLTNNRQPVALCVLNVTSVNQQFSLRLLSKTGNYQIGDTREMEALSVVAYKF